MFKFMFLVVFRHAGRLNANMSMLMSVNVGLALFLSSTILCEYLCYLNKICIFVKFTLFKCLFIFLPELKKY